MKLAFAVAILLARGLCVSAKPTTFKNSGLKDRDGDYARLAREARNRHFREFRVWWELRDL